MTDIAERLKAVSDTWLSLQHSSLHDAIVDLGENASPIERLLLVGFLISDPATHLEFKRNSATCGCVVPISSHVYGEIHHQHPVKVGRKTYALDFALIGASNVSIAIECDGHEFHEKTKEQARRDRVRERALVERGWLVLRFTGSEIWKDPGACGGAVFNTFIAESNRRRQASKAEEIPTK